MRGPGAAHPDPLPVPTSHPLPPYLRPPGALDEEAFVAACEHCGKCQTACPHDIILPLGPAYGQGEGTPAVLPRGGPCRMCDDLPCALACPSGALRPIPLATVRMGTARLLPDRCWSVQGRPCDACIPECPPQAAALGWDGPRPEVIEENCTGCGLCVAICPAEPAALKIIPAMEGRGRTPTDGSGRGKWGEARGEVP
ncbi:MAG: 4Fe-4S dicluster domain-containing protein [Acidobacteriota bacterium]